MRFIRVFCQYDGILRSEEIYWGGGGGGGEKRVVLKIIYFLKCKVMSICIYVLSQENLTVML